MEVEPTSTDSGHVQEELREAPVGLTLQIINLPSNLNSQRFNKKLKDLEISFVKADKPFKKSIAKIKFANQEDRQAAFTKLNGLEVDGVTWGVRIPADMGGELGSEVALRNGPANKKFKVDESSDASREVFTEGQSNDQNDAENKPLTVKDQVTPWHIFNYDHQLLKKQRSMKEILEKIVKRVKKDSVAKLPEWVEPILKQKGMWQACPLLPIIPSPLQEGYRNKTELTIGRDVDGNPAIGFLLGAMKNGYVAVGDPRGAPNVSATHEAIYELLQPFVLGSGLSIWERASHTGFWRLFLIRSTVKGESLIMFQVNPKAVTPERYASLKQELVEYVTKNQDLQKHNIKSIWIQEHEGVSNAADQDAPKTLLWGQEWLLEEMLGTVFRISPTSFFQVNTPAASLLYSLVHEWCGELDQNSTIFDVCCGTGTIGLCIAKNSKSCKEIVGLEIVEDAVLDAKANADLNNITNARFIAGKAEETMSKVVAEYPELNKKNGDASTASPSHSFIAILDPPRGGFHPKALRAIRECEAISKVIYVSCNPNSLVNDASVLTRHPSNSTPGTPFVPIQARPVDLFPHTHHTELVMLFERTGSEAAKKAIENSILIAETRAQGKKRTRDGEQKDQSGETEEVNSSENQAPEHKEESLLKSEDAVTSGEPQSPQNT